MLLRHTDLPDVDVLIAGHHGSRHSTSEELLREVTPETVIISVGEGNPYGHPAPELLQRLQDFGCIVYRTDQNGTITYRR
jgi:competence protein ComEC